MSGTISTTFFFFYLHSHFVVFLAFRNDFLNKRFQIIIEYCIPFGQPKTSMALKFGSLEW